MPQDFLFILHSSSDPDDASFHFLHAFAAWLLGLASDPAGSF